MTYQFTCSECGETCDDSPTTIDGEECCEACADDYRMCEDYRVDDFGEYHTKSMREQHGYPF